LHGFYINSDPPFKNPGSACPQSLSGFSILHNYIRPSVKADLAIYSLFVSGWCVNVIFIDAHI